MSQRREPLDSLELRQALERLFDRETLLNEEYHGEYSPLATYFPGPYADPRVEPVRFDPAEAVALLERAGWTDVGPDGIRQRDGKPLALTLTYDSPLMDEALASFQRTCAEAGIRIVLDRVDASTAWRNLREKEFQLQWVNWGGLVVPNPDTQWRSTFAFEADSNNVTAFVNGRVDYLSDKYSRTEAPEERMALIREIDGLIREDVPYVLGWYNPSQRVLYWNKFGMPAWATARAGTRASSNQLFLLWWFDPDRLAQIEQAKTDATARMITPPREFQFWNQWNETHPLPPQP